MDLLWGLVAVPYIPPLISSTDGFVELQLEGYSVSKGYGVYIVSKKNRNRPRVKHTVGYAIRSIQPGRPNTADLRRRRD